MNNLKRLKTQQKSEEPREFNLLKIFFDSKYLVHEIQNAENRFLG